MAVFFLLFQWKEKKCVFFPLFVPHWSIHCSRKAKRLASGFQLSRQLKKLQKPAPLFTPFGMEQSRARAERDGGGAGSTMALTPPSSPSAAPPPPPLSPTSPTSTANVDADAAAASPSSSAASSTPLRRRLFALGGLFQKVAASPLSPRRSQAPLKHVASECWEDSEDHHDGDDELDVSSSSPEELFAPAAVDEEEFLVSSLLLPVSSPPEWHQLPAHILELIVESALLPENELTTPWKERAVSFLEKYSTSL